MGNPVQQAAEQLLAALGKIPDLPAHRDMGMSISPPATVLGPPALTWDGTCLEPTEARFLVYVVVPADERALERLWDLVPLVSDALDSIRAASVIRADPGTYPSGGADLPAYSIQTDISLGGLA